MPIDPQVALQLMPLFQDPRISITEVVAVVPEDVMPAFEAALEDVGFDVTNRDDSSIRFEVASDTGVPLGLTLQKPAP